MLKTISSIVNAIGALNYKGTWNASTNTPTLASGVGTKGDYYVVSVAGSTNLDGETLWGVGDWAVFNGSIWQKVDGGSTGNFTSLNTGTLDVTGNSTLGDASTDTVTVNGYMGVGAAASTDSKLYIVGPATSGTNQYGVQVRASGTSGATGSVRAVYGRADTEAASFTTSAAVSFWSDDAIKGAGSTITNQHGVYISDQTQGTNNYGITSLVSSGANKWNIYASGTATNYFAGNVGIGTTAPYKTLHVRAAASGATSTTSLAHLVVEFNGNTGLNILTPNTASGYVTFGDPENPSGGRIEYAHTANYMAMFTTSIERMRLDSSGNLGLGVTPSAWSAGNFIPLQVGKGASIVGRGGAGTEDQIYVSANAYNDGSWKYIGTGNATSYYQDNGEHVWRTAPSGTAGNAISFTQAMTLTASGSLGVGTTSPNGIIHAEVASGNAVIRSKTGGSGSAILILETTGIGAQQINANTGSVQNLTMTVAGSERLRIDASGNVGIGTTSAITKLDVDGTSFFRNTQYINQPTPTAIAVNTTLSVAQILTQIITTSSGAITLTMPTGSTLDSGLPASFPNDGAFDFTIIDTDAGQTALNGNTGVTIVGSGSVGANSSGRFRLRKTGTATYVVYRLS